jgi:hypothetical protein
VHPLIDGEVPPFATKNVFSGNAGTPYGFFGVCKCCGLVSSRAREADDSHKADSDRPQILDRRVTGETQEMGSG